MGRMLAFIFPFFVALAAIWVFNHVDYTSKSSSIWCVRHISGNKMCSLHHVAFSSSNSSFDFFLTEESVFSGVETSRDLQKLQLSSLLNHNRFHANISMSFSSSRCPSVEESVVAVARFKPDNLMHAVHDDLLPLFVTLEFLCKGDVDACSQKYSLLLLDGHSEGPYNLLYRLFSKNVISQSSVDRCLAIKDLHVGLNLDTVWYQYGFESARGGTHSLISAEILWRFRKYMLRRLLVKDSIDPPLKIVIFSRTLSRKIINVDYVKSLVRSVYGRHVLCKVLDVRLDKTQELMKEIASAKVLIGLHGAEMILSLFLPANSTVIEILPSGIPSSVSFLEPLQNISHFRYIQWPADREGVRHPEYPAHLGGVEHLPINEKIRIKNTKSISQVRCCDDPVFLNLMYQDTEISENFEKALALSKTAPSSVKPRSKWFFPAHVRMLKCQIRDSDVLATWSPPSNAIGNEEYSAAFLLDDRNVAFVVKEARLVLKQVVRKASVWVSAVMANSSGPDSFVDCL